MDRNLYQNILLEWWVTNDTSNDDEYFSEFIEYVFQLGEDLLLYLSTKPGITPEDLTIMSRNAKLTYEVSKNAEIYSLEHYSKSTIEEVEEQFINSVKSRRLHPELFD